MLGFEDDILEYASANVVDTLVVQFYDVTLKRDFGPWKAGEAVDNLSFEFDKSLVCEYDSEGEIARKCVLKVEAQ